MPYLSKKRGLTQQPQVPVNLDRSLGLRRAVVMSLGRGQELVENVTVTTSDGSSIAPDLFTSLGKSYDGNGSAYNSLISVPSWTNTTNEASLCLVFTGQMQIGWVAGAGSLTHFPFSSLLYCNTFWSGRWVNGISLLSGDSWDWVLQAWESRRSIAAGSISLPIDPAAPVIKILNFKYLKKKY